MNYFVMDYKKMTIPGIGVVGAGPFRLIRDATDGQ